MNTVQMEYLRPGQVVEEKKRVPVVYFPVGPLEWHGPQSPVGTDALIAGEVARRAAGITGGVVLPTFYWGVDSIRSPQEKSALGLPEEGAVRGMDFPANSMRSLYVAEHIFATAIAAYLDVLVAQGYRLIVLVNAHGAGNQVATLQRLAQEYTLRGPSTVLYARGAYAQQQDDITSGHANQLETSFAMAMAQEDVDLGTLPPKGVPMRIPDYGIADSLAFSGQALENFVIRYDPRGASIEQGERLLHFSAQQLAGIVTQTLAGLSHQ
nr:creatininase family protein [bacterium]